MVSDMDQRRSFLRNPFRSGEQRAASAGFVPAEGSRLSRVFSFGGRKQQKQQQHKSPQSPTTQQDRAPSPPPSYAEVSGWDTARSRVAAAEVTASSPIDGGSAGSRNTRQPYQGGAWHSPRTAASADDDPYAFLSSFDTVFLIDDSGSMAGRSWAETQSALASIVPICTAHDKDGVDVYFLNHRTRTPAVPAKGSAGTGYHGVRGPAEVQDLFRAVTAAGGTPTGTRLNHILRPYLRRYQAWAAAAEANGAREGDDEAAEPRPLNIIVITDGVPTDDVESVLLQAARKLDALDAPPHQVGIQFFQVGDEPGAAEALRKLDDDLHHLVAGGVRDMVDTVSFDARRAGSATLTADAILKTVLGSVVKRLDRMKTARA